MTRERLRVGVRAPPARADFIDSRIRNINPKALARPCTRVCHAAGIANEICVRLSACGGRRPRKCGFLSDRRLAVRRQAVVGREAARAFLALGRATPKMAGFISSGESPAADGFFT